MSSLSWLSKQDKDFKQDWSNTWLFHSVYLSLLLCWTWLWSAQILRVLYPVNCLFDNSLVQSWNLNREHNRANDQVALHNAYLAFNWNHTKIPETCWQTSNLTVPPRSHRGNMRHLVDCWPHTCQPNGLLILPEKENFLKFLVVLKLDLFPTINKAIWLDFYISWKFHSLHHLHIYNI